MNQPIPCAPAQRQSRFIPLTTGGKVRATGAGQQGTQGKMTMTFGWKDRTPNGEPPCDPRLIPQVRAYWEALRPAGTLPRRDQVDPRGIAAALQHSFLIERIAPGLARFRIAGMVFHDLMAMDVRGMPLSCLFLAAARDQLQLHLERLFRSPAIVTLDLVSERSLGRPAVRARMQMLPMLGQDDTCTLALGCLDINAPSDGIPRRFGITTALSEAIAPQSASPSAQISAPPRAQPGVPHLRLVKI